MDDILGLEEAFHTEGASQARAAGAAAGKEDGRTLGWAAGSGLSAELSFYAGVAAALATLQLPPRARAAGERLSEAAARVPVHRVGNHTSVDFDAVLEEARRKFKEAVAFAGFPRIRFDADQPARMKDYSF